PCSSCPRPGCRREASGLGEELFLLLHRLPRPLDRLLVVRIAQTRLQREFEELESARVVAGFGVRHADVVVQRPGPVRVAFVEPRTEPLLARIEIVEIPERTETVGQLLRRPPSRRSRPPPRWRGTESRARG